MQTIPLIALRIHLAHCCAVPRIGRHLGITFSATGSPEVVSVPQSV